MHGFPLLTNGFHFRIIKTIGHFYGGHISGILNNIYIARVLLPH